jgi:hypothetical protein
MRGSLLSKIGVYCAILLFISGCGAAYSSYMSRSLKHMEKGDYEGALAKLEKPDGSTNKLLYRLEKGLIYHYQGRYAESNGEFEKAETLIDRLYTRSLSRETAALLTNDAVVAYRGEEFEQTLIHYYRAMNYERLGDRQAALVECRKANLKLENYAQKAEYELTYKNDAFLQYATGLFYEAEGELNDAYISYKDAEKGYKAYAETFGTRIPRMLLVDVTRLAQKLGYDDEVAHYRETYQLRPEELKPLDNGEVVVFIESGFVPRKHQTELNLPILKNDNGTALWTVSERAVDRYHRHYTYRRREVDYWLRVALPEYRTAAPPAQAVRLRSETDSQLAVLAEDIDAIARRTFEQKFDHILLRTTARGIAKYLASKGIEKAIAKAGDNDENTEFKEGLGALVGGLFNLFSAATEAADTRGWLSLPSSIHIARMPINPGATTLTLEFLDAQGRVTKTQALPPIEVAAEGKTFLSTRIFR